MPTDLTDLEQVIETYFDGLYAGDTAKLASVFHDASHLFSVTDGKLTDLPREQWFELIRSRKSAQSQELSRNDFIVHLDRSSPTICESAMSDTAKVFHRLPDAGEADRGLEGRVENVSY